MRLSNKKNTAVPLFTWLKWADRLYLPLHHQTVRNRLRDSPLWADGADGRLLLVVRWPVAAVGLWSTSTGAFYWRPSECTERRWRAPEVLVHHAPAGPPQADAAAAQLSVKRGGSLARENRSLQPQRRRDHLQPVFQEQFQPALPLPRWTQTPQQLTQRQREGANYCPDHLHNYNVFPTRAQYKNCKL